MQSLFIVFIYLFIGPSNVELPLPTFTQKEALNEVQAEAEKIGIDLITEEEIFTTDIVANSSVGRYMEHHSFNEEKVRLLQNEVTLYSYEVASIDRTYAYDMEQNRFILADNIYLQEDPDQFVVHYFGEGYELKGNKRTSEDELFDYWDVKKTYVAETSFTDIVNVVDIYLIGELIVGFEQYGLARGFPQPEESMVEIIAHLFILLFLASLVVFVTIHLIIKLVERQVEDFWEPFLLTIVAAFGWVFISKALGSSLKGIGIIEPLMMIYLTFATLLIRWKKDSRPLTNRIYELQPSVIHGFLLMFIAVLLAEGFFYIASYFDTWVSPVTTHNVLVQLDISLIPIFTLFIGLSAAITEEAIFRHYMVSLFERFGIFMSLVLTSFLWGILHIGYDMYLWYLYVLEFIVITGPFFYFVYMRYGFSASIFMHYFYNAWVTTLFLFTVDVRVAIVSLCVMLSPFLLFIVRKTNKRMDNQLEINY
ncbi:CPBP family intramembrane glutamic endopeptidase [Pueribacillus sp. YX66]|uniref:CPBP family intramembrane glutamic endopeptidase n=1 Tax=Pueribacillus sp. YX66 TaxID=3229242 RepID=UPI00358D6FBB